MSIVANTFGITMPRVFKFKDSEECSLPDQVLGVEIETELCTHNSDWYHTNLKPFGIDTKTDGSLRTVNRLPAYEFITRPTAMSNLLPVLRGFYQVTGFNEQNYTDRTSVHVHANCVDMTWEQVANLALIYTVVEEILFEFVNNRPGYRDNWSRDTNIYCVPWNQCRNHLGLINSFIKTPLEGVARWQKYTALNLAPLQTFGTVEFRHMHGTANMTKLATWINLIGSIMKMAKAQNLADLSAEINNLNTTSHYEKFFHDALGGYLPYTEVYRRKLEEGVIFAKYSMASFRQKKTKTTQEAPRIAPGTVGTGTDNPLTERNFAAWVSRPPDPLPRTRPATPARRALREGQTLRTPAGLFGSAPNMTEAINRNLGLQAARARISQNADFGPADFTDDLEDAE